MWQHFAFHQGLREHRMLLSNQMRVRLICYIACLIFTSPGDIDTMGITRTFLDIIPLMIICQFHMILQALVEGPLCVPLCHFQHYFLCLVSLRIDFYLHSLLHLHHDVDCPHSDIGQNTICRRIIPTTITPAYFSSDQSYIDFSTAVFLASS